MKAILLLRGSDGSVVSFSGFEIGVSHEHTKGLPDEEDDFNFVERFQALKAEFEALLVEEAKLNKAIAENLAKIKV